MVNYNVNDLVEDKFEDHERRIKVLEDRPISSGVVEGVDANKLSEYMKKTEFDDYLKRLEKCEKKAKKAKDIAKKA